VRHEKKHDAQENSRLRRDMPWLSTLGINLVFAGAVGLAIGYFLDKWLKTTPILTIMFFLIGTFAGFRVIYQEVQKMGKEEEKPHDPKD
jgi:ATP synthase protein I